MMKKLLLTSALLVIIISAIAQPPHGGGGGRGGNMPQITKGIMGRVVDENTSTPIEYANIALLKIHDSTMVAGTISDEKGFFVLDKVPNGIYNMRIKFIGYRSHSVNKIEISDNNPIIRLKALKLETTNVALESVDVTAKQEDVIFKIDKRVVNVSENISASGGTAVDALENTPGVEVDIDGNVSIRGSSNFTVLIDGKPTAMEGNEALQQIPASSIQEIEIITNPSAKYDPDGLTGILNIILKKDLKGGLNGVVSANVGNREQYNGSANFNYRKNKLNLIAGYSFRQGTRGGESEAFNKTFRDSLTFYRDETGDRGHKRLNHSMKLGFDYDFNDKNMLSITGNYRIMDRNRFNNSDYFTYTDPANKTRHYTEGENISEGVAYEVTGAYIHKFDKEKHELSTMASYSQNNSDEIASTSYTNFSIGDLQELETQTTNDHANATAQIDYTLPIGFSKFEAGAKSSLRNIDYTQSGDIYNQQEDAPDNDFRYIEEIHSFYAIYAGPIGGFEYQAGVRGEYSKVTTELLSIHDRNVREIFTIYPTLHVSYEFNEANKMQAGYSRRVNRPRTYFLNPYEERMDAFTIRKGNPDLDPEYAHSLELNYLKYIDKAFINTSIFYRQTDNNIGRVQKVIQEDSTQMTLMTFDNINKESSLGMEVSARNKFTKWLSINASYSFFRYEIKGEVDGENLSNNSLNHKLNGNANISIGKNSSIQLYAMYFAPSATSQGKREAFYFTGLGYKHLFFDKRLTLTARVRNPLGNFKWEFTTTGSNFENRIIRRPYFPMFNVGVSYRINEGFKRRKMGNGEGTSEDFDESMSID